MYTEVILTIPHISLNIARHVAPPSELNYTNSTCDDIIILYWFTNDLFPNEK